MNTKQLQHLQGDTVLHKGIVYTIIRIMEEPQRLALSNRGDKPEKRKSIPFDHTHLKESKDGSTKWVLE
jgi:hypothetical protein